MTEIYTAACQLNKDHASLGHVQMDHVSILSNIIKSLRNDTNVELRVIDELVGILGHLVGDINLDDKVGSKRIIDAHQAVFGALREYLKRA
jgi:hypothetical protein